MAAVVVADSMLCTKIARHDPHRWNSLITGKFYRCDGDPERDLEPLSWVKPQDGASSRVLRGVLLPCPVCDRVLLTTRLGLVRVHPRFGPHCDGSRMPAWD